MAGNSREVEVVRRRDGRDVPEEVERVRGGSYTECICAKNSANCVDSSTIELWQFKNVLRTLLNSAN